MINRLMWIWRGIDPREILDVQARIVMSDAERTDDDLYDTVIGYRGGNWIYEAGRPPRRWCGNKKPVRKKIRNSVVVTGCMRLRCRHFASLILILKEMTWPSKRRLCQTAPMKRPLSVCRAPCGRWSLPYPAVRPSPAFCICRKAMARSWQMCGGLDAMQTDYYSLYERYFAPRGIAMLTIDMPSVGFSSKWKLTQDSSLLHQHVLKALPNVPGRSHSRRGLWFPFRR